VIYASPIVKLEEDVDRADLTELRNMEPTLMIEDLEEISEEPTVSLRDLYRRWERQNWSAYALDFSQDAKDWSGLSEEVQTRLLWVMSMFFHGEECVTATLAPWVDAAPTSEMQIFLSTQLADEARHTVFFDRFYQDVVQASGRDMSARLEWAHPHVNDAFDYFFRELLPKVSKEVRDHPGDPAVFAGGIAFYHFITEGLLAVPGQRYLLEFCRKNDILPAFRSGFTAVARDESRHVGAGVRIVRELISKEPSAAEAVQRTVRESIQVASEIFQPPNADFTYFSVLGYDVGELFRFAINSLGKRLRSAGVPMPKLGPLKLKRVDARPVIPERPLTPLQQVIRPMKDEISVPATFQGMPVAFNPDAAKGVRASYQFDIIGEGGGTWTIEINDGSINVLDGPPMGESDQRLEMDVPTWISISVGDMIGNEAFLLGRVTVEGDPGAGARFDDFFRPAA
jgi:ribonucleoside-diphosphate reductase beta chain